MRKKRLSLIRPSPILSGSIWFRNVQLEEKDVLYWQSRLHHKFLTPKNGRYARTTKFKENKIGDGLSTGIHLIGTKLAQYFPFQFDDINEISDDVVFEN